MPQLQLHAILNMVYIVLLVSLCVVTKTVKVILSPHMEICLYPLICFKIPQVQLVHYMIRINTEQVKEAGSLYK